MAEHDHKSDKSGYDKAEINTRSLLIWAVACVVFVVVSIVFVVQYFSAVREETVYNQVLKPESVPLRDLRAHEEQVLNSYKLLDPVKGTYQIPIDRAMELVADEAYRGKTSR
jgi:hypothetical protein